MNTRLFSALVAVPILLVLSIAPNLASSQGAKAADIANGRSPISDARLAGTRQQEPALSSPVASGRQTRECRILRICD